MRECVDEEKERKFVLIFTSLAKHAQSKLSKAEQPVWEGRVEVGLKEAFEFGGHAVLSHLGEAENVYIRHIGMNALPGQFRIVALTNDTDYKKEVLEWWEPGDSPFRGTIVFGDDPWDARTVCTDLEVAIRIFRDMYEHGDLSDASLSEMRSSWDPKP